MKHTQVSTAQTSGKSQMLVLFIIGMLGAAGLFYVLNASNDKSGFSQKQQEQQIELAQNQIQQEDVVAQLK